MYIVLMHSTTHPGGVRGRRRTRRLLLLRSMHALWISLIDLVVVTARILFHVLHRRVGATTTLARRLPARRRRRLLVVLAVRDDLHLHRVRLRGLMIAKQRDI